MTGRIEFQIKSALEVSSSELALAREILPSDIPNMFDSQGAKSQRRATVIKISRRKLEITAIYVRWSDCMHAQSGLHPLLIALA